MGKNRAVKVRKKRRRQERRRLAEMKRRAAFIAELQLELAAQVDRTMQAERELMELKQVFFGSNLDSPERLRTRIQIDDEVYGRLPGLILTVRPDPLYQYPFADGLCVFDETSRFYRIDLVAERGWEKWTNMEILVGEIRRFWDFAAKRKAEGVREKAGATMESKEARKE